MNRRVGSGLLTVLLALTLGVTACEKERKTRFVQGTGEYVYSINEFKGSTYTLKTGKKRTPGVTTRADELYVNPGSNVMRSFDSVEFELSTDVGDFSDKTLNNFDFYGKEDSEYTVQLDFTEDKLVFFKLAKKEDLPTNELTYAESTVGGLYRVPLFGLPLHKYTLERVKDDRGKSSNQVNTYTKDFLKDSTHFGVDKDQPSYFDSQLKLDMLPSSFFDEGNQWFYTVTVVDKPMALDASQLELGYQLGEGRVRFSKTNNSILAVDLNISEEAQTQSSEKLNIVFELPVQWMDYRLVKGGADAYMKEEAFDDIAKGARFWKDRDFALMKLDRVLQIDAASTENVKIKRLEVSDDYFSFTIFDSLSKISLHYSFARENNMVEGKVYPLEDWKRFGFFPSQKSVYAGELMNSEKASDQSVLQNRMYPLDNVVQFHITEETPRDPVFLEAIQAAIDGWDQAFVEAAKGTKYEKNPIRVKVDIEKPVKNGDVRYHKVAFYGYEIQSTLLGYGPSVADNRNGEVFSSTNNIYLRNYREDILRNLVRYIRYKLGAFQGLNFDGMSVPDQILAVSGNPGYTFDPSTAVASGFVSTGNLAFEALPSASPNPKSEDLIIDWKTAFQNTVDVGTKSISKKAAKAVSEIRTPSLSSVNKLQTFMAARAQLQSGALDQTAFNKTLKEKFKKGASGIAEPSCDLLAATSLTFKEIEDVCGKEGDPFVAYINDLKAQAEQGNTSLRLDNERDILYACAQKLMKPTLIATLAHEFGHNFGLRHNFAGSSDFANFEKDEKGQPIARTASVMDYSHQDADRGFKPAPYDVATIRYGYYDAVEAIDKGSNNEVKIVDISSRLDDRAPVEARLARINPNYVPKRYEYCTDEWIMGDYVQVPIENPFCERWDQGSDPVTKVRASIDSMSTMIIMSGSRFDMTNLASPEGLAASSLARYMGGMKSVYEKYRFMLYNSSKAISAKSGKLLDDPYFDSSSNAEAEAEKMVLGETELARAKALIAKLKAQPNLDTKELEPEVHTLSQVAQYYVASKLYEQFLIEVIFSQSNYCVALHNTGDSYEYLDAEPVATVRAKNFYLTGADAADCNEMVAYFQGKIATNNTSSKSVDRVIAVGNPFENVAFSSDPEKMALRNDLRTGMYGIRTLALGVLAARTGAGNQIFSALVGGYDAEVAQYGLGVAAIAGFFPSPLDGKEFRDQYTAKLTERLTQGVSEDKLRLFADQKLFKTEGKRVAPNGQQNFVQVRSDRYLPFYQEEKLFLENEWLIYKIGVVSPRAVTGTKSADTQIQSLDFVNFIGFQGDQQYPDYLVSSDGTAYFTRGATAKKLIGAFNETQNKLDAITAKNALATDEDKAVFDTKIVDVVGNYMQLLTKTDDHYQSLADVLFQVRVCVLKDLLNKYALPASESMTLQEHDYDGARFSTENCSGAEKDSTTLAERGKLEAQFTTVATDYLNYIKKDAAILKVETVEQILSLAGLPDAPSDVEDPAATLERVFKGQDSLPFNLISIDYAIGDAKGRKNPYLNSLEYGTILKAIEMIKPTKGPNAGKTMSIQIPDAVSRARQAYFDELKVDEPYTTLLNDKLEVLRNLIFSPY